MQEVFHWDLMSISDSIPTHIVSLLLANGVIFDNEGLEGPKAVEIASKVAERALQFLDILVWEKGSCPLIKDMRSSLLAAAVIHAARSEELLHFEDRNHERLTVENFDFIKTAHWPSELVTLTGWQAKDIDEIAKLLIKLNL